MRVIKDGRKIVGWVERQKDGSYGYVFGRHSQPSFLMFYTDTEEKAVSRILETRKEFKQLSK